jgi:aspartyl-tRNA(Asn)/glutamyl-tRNA(Gln) amidotransferase subunit C
VTGARHHPIAGRAAGWRQYHPPVAGLTRSDVEHVAFLARLALTPEELDRLEGQLNHILDQYAKLAELDTSAIAPTAQTIELANILREDVAGSSLAVEAVLRNAPSTEGDFIVVPRILGGEAP